MEHTLPSFSESRLRKIFGKSNEDNPGGDGPRIPAGADPLFPSLDLELPDTQKTDPEFPLYRPSWDPRDRWRQLRPSQPVHAPPEDELPAQFRYEDLSALEKSETMEAHQDRLLSWLMERFDRTMEFKDSGEMQELTAEEAVRIQEFTPLQILDEQLTNLGLSSADLKLHERRRHLLGVAQPAAAAATVTEPVSASTLSSTWEQECEGSEFSQFVSPQQQQQVVVTVHEAELKPRWQKPEERGDLASDDSTIECEVDIKKPLLPRSQRRQHRVAQFGDMPSCGSNSGSNGPGANVKVPGKKTRIAEESV